MNYPYSQPWYANSTLHHCYLFTCVIILLLINFSDEAGAHTHLLFVIHFVLLMWKFLNNQSFMRFFFRVRPRPTTYEEKLSDKTLKFAPRRKNYSPSENLNEVDEQRRIEEAMFGRKTRSPYVRTDETTQNIIDLGSREYDSKPRHRYAYEQNASNQINEGNAFRTLFFDNDTRGIKNIGQSKRISEFSNKDDLLESRSPKSSFFPRQQLQARQNSITNRIPYQQPKPERAFFNQPQLSKQPNLTGPNQFRMFNPDPVNLPVNLNPQFDQVRNPFHMNFNRQFHKSDEKKSFIKAEIYPLMSEFIKFKISEFAAKEMILFVRKHFEQRIKEYKARQIQTFEKLRGLVQKVTQSRPSFANYQTLTKFARSIVYDYLKKQETKLYKTQDQQQSEGYFQSLKNVLDSIYFDGIFNTQSKIDVIRFYKEQTELEILRKTKLQIIYSEITHNPIDGPPFTNRIYYNVAKDFCFCHEGQVNHQYNVDETFLFLFLANKQDNLPSLFLNELQNISWKRNLEIPQTI